MEIKQETVIDLRLVEVAIDLSTLNEQVKLIEEHISQAEETARNKLETGLGSLTSHDDYDYESQMLNHEHDYLVEILLPRVYRSPFIVVLFAVYEATVKEIASLIQKGQGEEISLDDLKGDFLTQAKKYYLNVLHFKLSRNESHWKRLRVLYQVRNVIAHANGRSEMTSSEQKKLLRKEGLAHGYGWVLVGKSFLAEMYSVVGEDLSDLVARYKAWDSARSSAC